MVTSPRVTPHFGGDVPQVVGEAPANGKSQQLSAIEAKTHSAGTPHRPIDDHRVGARPPHRCLCACHVADFHG